MKPEQLNSIFRFGLSWESGVDYQEVYSFSAKHSIPAIVWDEFLAVNALGKIKPEFQPSKAQKIQWALATEQVEQRYARQKSVIERLATFFAGHDIKMMILKGYGLSLNYPVPHHRPCSDIDIWLFEERILPNGHIERCSVQQKADRLLQESLNVQIDEDKHHHTVFYLDGVMVENHYDFLNVHAHPSNRIIEARLQQLAQQPMEQVVVGNAMIYLPSADFHALFLLRHTAAHFAAERIVIRHLLDWRYFVEKYSEKIDWQALQMLARQVNMCRFFDCLNVICIDKLGLSNQYVPTFARARQLEERVWNEIMQPEFSEPQPRNVGYMKSWSYMFRRWWANRWKHRIVYNEGLLKTFIVQLWSHLLKPKSLKL